MASEYGWSIREISKLTYREVNYLLRHISRRTHNDYVFHANIHGIKMKPIDTIEPVDAEANFTEEQNEKAKRVMEKMIKRRMAKHGR